MSAKNTFVLLLEYYVAWDRGDSEKCVIPILVTRNLKRAIKKTETKMRQLKVYGTEINCYALVQDELTSSEFVNGKTHHKYHHVFSCTFYGMNPGIGTDMAFEWVDKTLEPK